MTSSKRDVILGIGGLVAFLVSALVVAGVVAFAVTRKRRLAQSKREENLALGGRPRSNGAPARLSLAEIREATGWFYRGRIVKRFQRLKNRAAVACSSSNNNNHHPFANELATVIGCLRHKNLVQLRGWCWGGDELVLVYVVSGGCQQEERRVRVRGGGAGGGDGEEGGGGRGGGVGMGMSEQGRLRDAVDPRQTAAEDLREAEGLVAVGLPCVHPNQVKQPTAREARRILRGEAPLPPLPARRPRLRVKAELDY